MKLSPKLGFGRDRLLFLRLKYVSYLSRILGAGELLPNSVAEDLRSRTKEDPRLECEIPAQLNLKNSY